MTALVTVARGLRAGEAELREALSRAGVLIGLDEAACRRLSHSLGDGTFTVKDLPLAHGRPAVSRHDGGFEPAFQTGAQPGRMRDDGSIDFYDHELLKPAHVGDVLGRVVPARSGVTGMRVDGRPQPSAHLPSVHPQFGPGALMQADGTVIATRAGTIVYRPPDLLDVVEQHVHEGNVDVRSGHLSTEGSLVIRGDVKRTFGVRALGDLEIHGAVESGSVYAGGNIHVHGGVGGGDGIVSACGDVKATHAERTTLISGGTLTLDDSVHCVLQAQTIEIQRALRGGKASAELSITAEHAGAPNGKAETLLSVGLPIAPPELVPYPVIVQTIHEYAALPHRESERPLTPSSLVMLATHPPGRSASSYPAPGASSAPTRLSSIPPRPQSVQAMPAAAIALPPSSPRRAPSAPIAPARAPSAPPGSIRPMSSAPASSPSTAPRPASRSQYPSSRPPQTQQAQQAQEEAIRRAAEEAAARHAHAQHLLETASIQIFGVAHPGVVIQIGDVRLVLDEPQRNVRFMLDVAARKIRTSPAER